MILLSPVCMLRLVSLLCHIKMNFSPSPFSRCEISKSVSFFFIFPDSLSSTPFFLFIERQPVSQRKHMLSAFDTSLLWNYLHICQALKLIQLTSQIKAVYTDRSVLMDLRWLSIRKNNPSGAGNYYISDTSQECVKRGGWMHSCTPHIKHCI